MAQNTRQPLMPITKPSTPREKTMVNASPTGTGDMAHHNRTPARMPRRVVIITRLGLTVRTICFPSDRVPCALSLVPRSKTVQFLCRFSMRGTDPHSPGLSRLCVVQDFVQDGTIALGFALRRSRASLHHRCPCIRSSSALQSSPRRRARSLSSPSRPGCQDMAGPQRPFCWRKSRWRSYRGIC
jgi:hypothetical protein